MANQNRVNGRQPKFAECCEQDIVLLDIMIICIECEYYVYPRIVE